MSTNPKARGKKSRMPKRVSVALLFAVIAWSATAQSPKKGDHGGDVVVMEGHPIEFVSKDQEITFYILEDDGKSPTPTRGFAGRAVIQDSGKTFAVNLSPAEPNMFVGQLPTPLGAKARVVLSAKVEGHNLQARFTTN
jgi:hypothetical protein